MAKNKFADIALHGASACLGIALMTQPDVNFVNPDQPSMRKTFKDGMPAVRVETQRGQPYPLKTYGALLLTGHSLAIVLKLFGTNFFSDTYNDIFEVFHNSAENMEPLPLNIPSVFNIGTTKGKDPDSLIDIEQAIKDFLTSPNGCVIGDPGSGKTSILRKLLLTYLAMYPDCEVTICDPAVGKEANTWLGLIYGVNGDKVVFSSDADIVQQINNIYCEMQLRRAECDEAVRTGKTPPNKPPVLCIVDEFTVLSKTLKADDLNQVLDQIQKLILLGRGFGIKFILGMHNPTSKDNASLSQAFMQTLNKIWLLNEKFKPNILAGYYPLDTKDPEDEAILNRSKDLVRSGDRAMIITSKGRKYAVKTPYYQLADIVANPFTKDNQLRQWWSDTLATHEPEANQMIDDFLAKKRKSPLTEIADLMGVRPALNNEKYTDYLKPWFDNQIKSKQLIEV